MCECWLKISPRNEDPDLGKDIMMMFVLLGYCNDCSFVFEVFWGSCSGEMVLKIVLFLKS